MGGNCSTRRAQLNKSSTNNSSLGLVLTTEAESSSRNSENLQGATYENQQAGPVFGKLRKILKNVWNSSEGKLAEIENKSSETLMFCEKNREVWKKEMFKLEPRAKFNIHSNCDLINGAGTFDCMEVLLVTSQGRMRPVPPLCIEPWELVRCKQLIIHGAGTNLRLEKIHVE